MQLPHLHVRAVDPALSPTLLFYARLCLSAVSALFSHDCAMTCVICPVDIVDDPEVLDLFVVFQCCHYDHCPYARLASLRRRILGQPIEFD